MAETSPRMAWAYPSRDADPWYDEFEDFVKAADASGFAAREDRSLVFAGGGTISWTLGTETLAWSGTMFVLSPMGGRLISIAAGSETLEEGELLYLSLTRQALSNVTATLTKATQVPSNDQDIVLCFRRSNRIHFRTGFSLGNADTADSLAPTPAAGGGSPLVTEDEGTQIEADTRVMDFVGDGVTVTSTIANEVQVTIPGLEVQSEGTPIETAVDTLDFRGGLFTVTNPSPEEVRVTVAGLTVEEEGSSVETDVTTMDFVGANITATSTGAGSVQVSVSGVGQWIRDASGFVYLSTATDDVYIGGATPNGVWFDDGDMVLGAAAMSGTEKLRVVGDARIEGKLTVTGMVDPTGMLFNEQATVPQSPSAGEGTLWVRDDTPNRVIFTDDTPADNVLAFLSDAEPSLPGITNVFFVDKGTVTGSEDGSPQNPYHSIQTAITAAVATTPSATNPAVVYVYPGVYDEQITLSSFVWVVGMSQGGVGQPVTGNFGAAACTLTNAVGDVVTVGGADTGMEGFLIEASTSGLNCVSGSPGGNVLFRWCRFEETGNQTSPVIEILGGGATWRFEDCQFNSQQADGVATNVAFTGNLHFDNCWIRAVLDLDGLSTTLTLPTRFTGCYFDRPVDLDAANARVLFSGCTWTSGRANQGSVNIGDNLEVEFRDCDIRGNGAGASTTIYMTSDCSLTVLGSVVWNTPSTAPCIDATTAVTGAFIDGNVLEDGVGSNVQYVGSNCDVATIPTPPRYGSGDQTRGDFALAVTRVADPTAPLEGDVWYEGTADRVRYRDGTATRTVAHLGDIPAGAGLWSQTGAVIHPTTGTDDLGIGAAGANGRWFDDGDMVLGGTAMSGTEVLRVVGSARVEGGLLQTESASVPIATAAGEGEFWTKNDAPSKAYFTDDDGNDHALAYESQVLPSFRSYSFTSASLVAGTFYAAGYYDAPAADANLTDAATTQTYGSANHPYGAHAFIVAGGAGTVDTGTVAIQVQGTSITDAGVRTASDTENIVADITTLSANQYVESTKKWIGQITFALIETVPDPTTYSVDFNYGFAKYEDWGGRDFTLTDVEVVGVAGAADTGFDVEVLYHSSTGWTYSAAAFAPGATPLASMETDTSTESDLTANEPFAWRRTNLSQAVTGSGSEGVIVRVVAGAADAVDYMDLHLGASLV